MQQDLMLPNELDFGRLDPRQFEELCFDLLMNVGYESMSWRQGGADQGRDIEALRSVSNSLIGTFVERWFFECKHYSSGVPAEELSSKIAWADAEQPKFLVFLISSYLTTSARTWIEKIRPQKPYAIHVIEGKALQAQIAQFSNIVEWYFLDAKTKLMLEEQRRWLIHNLMPSVECIFLLSRDEELRLRATSLAFLAVVYHLRMSEVESWIEDNEEFNLDHLFSKLAACHNTDKPILDSLTECYSIEENSGSNVRSIVYPKYFAAQLGLDVSTNRRRLALYCFWRDSEGEGVEVLVEARSDFPTLIRHVSRDASTEMSSALARLRHLNKASVTLGS